MMSESAATIIIIIHISKQALREKHHHRQPNPGFRPLVTNLSFVYISLAALQVLSYSRQTSSAIKLYDLLPHKNEAHNN